MKTLVRQSLKNIQSVLPLFIVELSYFSLFARLDPEGHHDGVMLAAAIGVSEGAVPNKDVFTQYGPLTPLLQGFWLFLTEPTLLSLRIFTAIQLSLCGALLFWLLRPILTVPYSAAISLAWSLSYPFFILPIDLPWASVLTTLLALVTMAILRDVRDKEKSTYRFAIASALLALGIFARIHMIVPLSILGLYLVVLWRQTGNSKPLKVWALSSIATLASALFLLIKYGALEEFFHQCILWPSTYYAAPAIGFTKGEIVAMALLLFFPGFLFLLWSQIQIGKSAIGNIPKTILYSAVTWAVIVLANTHVDHKSYLNPVYVAVSISQNFPSILGYSAVTLLLIFIWAERKKLSFLRIELLPVAIGAALLPQLYPAHDTLHLYWITPAAIASVALYLRNKNPSGSLVAAKQIIPTVISIIVAGLVLSGIHLAKPREGYHDPVLRGMIGEELTRKPIDEILSSLRELPTGSSIEFDCAHGLFAVAGGKYLPSDLRFVNWGSPIKSNLKYDYKLSCDLTENEAKELRKNLTVVSEARLATGQIIQLSKN